MQSNGIVNLHYKQNPKKYFWRFKKCTITWFHVFERNSSRRTKGILKLQGILIDHFIIDFFKG